MLCSQYASKRSIKSRHISNPSFHPKKYLYISRDKKIEYSCKSLRFDPDPVNVNMDPPLWSKPYIANKRFRNSSVCSCNVPYFSDSSFPGLSYNMPYTERPGSFVHLYVARCCIKASWILSTKF